MLFILIMIIMFVNDFVFFLLFIVIGSVLISFVMFRSSRHSLIREDSLVREGGREGGRGREPEREGGREREGGKESKEKE